LFIACRAIELRYRATDGDEVEDLEILLRAVKSQIPDVGAVSTGAIASDYQRLRVENVCSRLGLVSLAYMWKQDQTSLLENMVIMQLLDLQCMFNVERAPMHSIYIQ
jgi:diphthine-ammonia ligase